MNKKLVVVQQYLSWKGHYRQYFENLLDSTYYNICSSNQREIYQNGTWLKSEFDANKPLTITQKIKGRFFDSFKAYQLLSRSRYDIVHLLEFEPLCYLLFASKINKHSQLIITIHSSDRLHYNGWLNNKISGFHRFLLTRALKIAVNEGATIVTHYEVHKESLIEILGEAFNDHIKVIEYPAPTPRSEDTKEPLSINTPKFLIYGQIREDKGIYEFLQRDGAKKLNITIAGKIVDRRIFEHSKNPNLTIIDKFLSEEEIDQLVESHDYMLLPYSLNYTNGAGTFKDSLSKGMPVVCSDISIFREIVDKHHVGIIFTSVGDIEAAVAKVDPKIYAELSANCLKYARKYNWEYMRKEYFRLYEGALHSLNNSLQD